jgi:rod shape-determining protein MreC
VLLISDPSHSVPVQVARSNLRLVAQGTGVNHRLNLIYVQNTADVRTGDLLISSGLGKKFPVGYPVGVVNKVQHRPGQPFAEVTAVPSALLDRSRHVLLVFTKDRLANHQGTQRNGNGG